MTSDARPAGQALGSAAAVRALAAIHAAITAVYRDTARPVREIAPASLLGPDLGLDSLDLAQVVVLLERDLGVDPFRDPRSGRTSLRTVEHLALEYAAALDRAPGAASH